MDDETENRLESVFIGRCGHFTKQIKPMGILNLFRKKPSKIKKEVDFKPILGGDGLTPQTALILNCSSMGVARHLINKFISENHGEINTGWKPTIEYFVTEEDIPEFSIRAYGIKLSNEVSHTYYFDVSRQHKNEMKIAKMMGLIPELDE